MKFRSPGNPIREDYDHIFLAYMAMNLRTAVIEGLRQRLAPLGITPMQMAIIIRCHTGDASNVTELARIIPMTTGSISRQVEQLVNAGLLWREYESQDRRVARLGLTEPAERMMPEILRHWQGNETALLAGFSMEDKKALVAMIEKILANAAGQDDPLDSEQGLAGGGGVAGLRRHAPLVRMTTPVHP